jgi:8-oxo-dGTP pyrophosphatase MutT (NUDIX family)
VLLFDPAGRVLLLHGRDPARPDHEYWFTVGGGIDPDESLAEGAARELFEETGVRTTAADLVGPVYSEVTEFPFDGRWYRQEQDFFVLRVPSCGIDFSRHNDIERATVDAYRWWSVADMRASAERFYPPDLAALVQRVTGC